VAGDRAGLTALYEHTRVEHPKYYEALQRIELARREGERLVFRCATRAEARSLEPLSSPTGSWRRTSSARASSCT